MKLQVFSSLNNPVPAWVFLYQKTFSHSRSLTLLHLLLRCKSSLSGSVRKVILDMINCRNKDRDKTIKAQNQATKGLNTWCLRGWWGMGLKDIILQTC